MDILQITLIVVLVLLAINLMIVGVYLIMVLRDFRETIKKANSVLDNANVITDAVANPSHAIAGIIAGVTQSVKAVKGISSLVDNSKKRSN